MARTQENRQAELITPLGTDVLLFHHMVVSEGVSQLFECDLTVFSEDENIPLDKLIGHHAHVELELPHGRTRCFCGHVTRFSFLGFRGPMAKYKIEMKPWLWFLARATNNRIFQQEKVPDIIKKVCADHGFTDIDDRLTRSYGQREYCVQYRETDLNFIRRLMEDEGIYFYFRHEPGKHELVLADSISAHEPNEGYAIVPWFPPDQHDHRERDHLDTWHASRMVRSGKVSLRDYNFLSPSTNMEVKSQMIADHEHAEYEKYDYPGNYSAPAEGEGYARLRIEEEQADMEVLRGGGNARGLIPGYLFEFEDYPRNDQNREYLILWVTHDILQDEYDASSEGGGFNYACTIQAMPSNIPFRAPCTTPRSVVLGPQTAVVVGEAGQEIWTDEHGRVKVQFHWDREGQKNENSSCWVRVSQGWAGKKWGMQFLPRIGHEVVVEFLEGDPDRPLVTGSVYNAENKPPYDLPSKATQSGIKTRSSMGGSGANYNEIRFEDKKGSEVFYLHAEKDRKTEVENDDALKIGRDRKKEVDRDEKIEVRCKREEKIGQFLKQEVGIDREAKIGADEKLKVGGERKTEVGKDNALEVKGDHTTKITGDWDHSSQNLTANVKAKIDVMAGVGVDITSPGQINILSPTGVKIGHNPLYSIGIASTSIDQTVKEMTNDKVAIKNLSVGMTDLKLDHTTFSVSHTTFKYEVPGVKLNKAKAAYDKQEGIDLCFSMGTRILKAMLTTIG